MARDASVRSKLLCHGGNGGIELLKMGSTPGDADFFMNFGEFLQLNKLI